MGQPARWHLAAELDDPSVRGDEEKIEGEPHPEGVDAAAIGDQQPLRRPLPIDEGEAEKPGGCAGGDGHGEAEDGAPGEAPEAPG